MTFGSHRSLRQNSYLSLLSLDITGFAGFFYCVFSLMYRFLSQPKTGHFGSVFGCFSEGHWRDVQPLQRGVHTHDRIGGCHFRGEMKVRIDVGSRRNIVLFVLPGLLFLFDRLIIRPKNGQESDCRKTCPGGNYGGKDRVKGNRQGVLLRSITRRSGKTAMRQAKHVPQTPD